MPQIQKRVSPRDWSLLQQLPMAVGIWMAHQDQGGGPRAALRARTALETVLLTSRKKYASIPLLAEVLAGETPIQEDTQWANALQDCRNALGLLAPLTDATSLNCFRLMLIDIAEAVARAAPNGQWKSYNLYNGPRRGWLGLYPLMANVVRLGRGPNVTRTEKIAINTLITTLGAGALVQNWDLDPFRERSQA